MGKPQSDRPNVIVFFTDQQRWDTVGCYGSPMELTPNLDRLAAGGVQAELAFTCQPVCAPARASLQTGKYATAAGVWRNGVPLPPDQKTLAHHFKQAGYRVGYIGKWHLGPRHEDPVAPQHRGGYDYWQAANVLEFTSHPYEGQWFDELSRPVKFAGRYRVDALTDKAMEFVAAGGERPFFLFFSLLEPHFQNDMKRFVAPDGYARRYANCHVPPDLAGHPGDWMSELPDYYGMCASIDENLGRLVGQLERGGLMDNTILVFTSDHGCHFRTRNAEYKRSCHESSVRIPLVFRGPGFDRRLVLPELVSLVDVPPTLLAAAGLDVPPDMQGRSILPLLDRRNQDWPEDVFFQISESMVARGLRTRRWKYCAYAPDLVGWDAPASPRYVDYQFYDLSADPHEQVNLAGRGDCEETAKALRARLIERMIAAGEPAPVIEPARFFA